MKAAGRGCANEANLVAFDPDWNLKDTKKVVRERSPLMRSYVRPEILQELKGNMFIWEEKRRAWGQRKPRSVNP